MFTKQKMITLGWICFPVKSITQTSCNFLLSSNFVLFTWKFWRFHIPLEFYFPISSCLTETAEDCGSFPADVVWLVGFSIRRIRFRVYCCHCRIDWSSRNLAHWKKSRKYFRWALINNSGNKTNIKCLNKKWPAI